MAPSPGPNSQHFLKWKSCHTYLEVRITILLCGEAIAFVTRPFHFVTLALSRPGTEQIQASLASARLQHHVPSDHDLAWDSVE